MGSDLSTYLHDPDRWPVIVRVDDTEVRGMQWRPDDVAMTGAMTGWLSGCGIDHRCVEGRGRSENLRVGGGEANPGDWVLFDVDRRRVAVMPRMIFYRHAVAADPPNRRPPEQRVLLRLAGEWEAEADWREAYATSDGSDGEDGPDEDGPDELAMGVELNLAELLRRNAAALRQIADG